MAISKDDIALIVKEVLQQTGQQGTQQSSQQVGEAIAQAIEKAQQITQGSTQEKSSVVDSITQNKQEEILGGEAIRAGTVSGSRLWNWNDKSIAQAEHLQTIALNELVLQEKQLALREKQHDFSVKQKQDHQLLSNAQFLDQVKVRNAQNNGSFDKAIEMEYARFNNAVAEPISPDTGSDSKDAQK